MLIKLDSTQSRPIQPAQANLTLTLLDLSCPNLMRSNWSSAEHVWVSISDRKGARETREAPPNGRGSPTGSAGGRATHLDVLLAVQKPQGGFYAPGLVRKQLAENAAELETVFGQRVVDLPQVGPHPKMFLCFHRLRALEEPQSIGENCLKKTVTIFRFTMWRMELD